MSHLLNNFKKHGLVIHLTMYGEEVDIIMDKIKPQVKDILENQFFLNFPALNFPIREFLC